MLIRSGTYPWPPEFAGISPEVCHRGARDVAALIGGCTVEKPTGTPAGQPRPSSGGAKGRQLARSVGQAGTPKVYAPQHLGITALHLSEPL